LDVDDDEKPKPRAPFENPEMEFRARIAERHGTIVDAKALLQDVTGELDGAPLSEFLKADTTATTAPHKLTNPHGHYRRLARQVGRRRDAATLEAIFETQERAREFLKTPEFQWKPSCTLCDDGLLPDGAYCDCKVGGLRREVDELERSALVALDASVGANLAAQKEGAT
jgi:hypothetical protein